MVGGGAVLAACDAAIESIAPTRRASPAPGATGPTGPVGADLQWWDQFAPLEALHQEVFAAYAEASGGSVEHTVTNPQEQGQSLQLAFQSDQMPDVFTLAGVGVPAAQLQSQGWFSALAWSEETRAMLPEGAVIEGTHIFDGELYSFPIFTFRQYETVTWYNRQLLEQADVDPENPPGTWDEFRAATRAVREAGGDEVYGWILPIGFPGRLEAEVHELVQGAGFRGAAGLNFETGEYGFASDPYVDVIEFLLALQADGVLHPASSSLDAREARARWATGIAGFFFDGPWNIGVATDEFADFAPSMGAGPILVRDAGTPVIHQPPTGGTFWISSQSENVQAASDLLATLLSSEYQVGLANRMDQPPIDLDAVDQADVNPEYSKVVGFYREQVFLAPSPTQKNPAVAAVEAAMRPVEPNLGQIIQGAFSGDVTDIRSALQQFNDGMSQQREEAIAQVTGEGMEVSQDDWTFPDWQPGSDYSPAG